MGNNEEDTGDIGFSEYRFEYGIITFASSEPLRELYELMQMEMVRKIDGTRLAVKVDEIPE